MLFKLTLFLHKMDHAHVNIKSLKKLKQVLLLNKELSLFNYKSKTYTSTSRLRILLRLRNMNNLLSKKQFFFFWKRKFTPFL